MRFTILSLGSRGDVQPLIALGQGLIRAGHQVRFGTSRRYESLLAGYAPEIEYSPLSLDIQTVFDSPEGRAVLESKSLVKFLKFFARLRDTVIPQILEEFWQAGQDAEVIINTFGGWGGYFVAEKLGIPCFQANLQPNLPTRAFPNPYMPAGPGWSDSYNRLTHYLFEQMGWRVLGPPTNRWLRSRLGLPAQPFSGPYARQHRRAVPQLCAFSPAVVPKPFDWPEWYFLSGYWFLERPAGWQPPKALVDFLASGPAPVYVGFGSMPSRNPQETTEIILEALAKNRQRAVLMSSEGAFRPAGLPDEVFFLEEAPHDWLFPQMSALVHHGGAGTTATGLRAGAPALVVPFLGEQSFWGRRLHDLGVSPKPVARKDLTAERLSSALRSLTGDHALRKRAAALGRQIQAEKGVARAVEFIEQRIAAPD